MAHGSGCDLLHRGAATSKPLSVVLRGQIADKSGDTMRAPQNCQRFFEERCLAGARAGNQTHNPNITFSKFFTKLLRNEIVLFQHTFSNFDNSRNTGHGSISTPTTSSTRPSVSCTTKLDPSAGVPSHARPKLNSNASLATPASEPTSTRIDRTRSPP